MGAQTKANVFHRTERQNNTMIEEDLNFSQFHKFLLKCTGRLLRTKHTNLTIITLTRYDHVVNVVKLHADYLFISFI